MLIFVLFFVISDFLLYPCSYFPGPIFLLIRRAVGTASGPDLPGLQHSGSILIVWGPRIRISQKNCDCDLQRVGKFHTN